jgi:hypothetical protein
MVLLTLLCSRESCQKDCAHNNELPPIPVGKAANNNAENNANPRVVPSALQQRILATAVDIAALYYTGNEQVDAHCIGFPHT